MPSPELGSRLGLRDTEKSEKAGAEGRSMGVEESEVTEATGGLMRGLVGQSKAREFILSEVGSFWKVKSKGKA